MANGRCRMHGGASTGPKTANGRERIRAARWRHGCRSAAARDARRQARLTLRAVLALRRPAVAALSGLLLVLLGAVSFQYLAVRESLGFGGPIAESSAIARVQAEAQPIIFLFFSSARHSGLEITDYAERMVKPALQTLPGVAAVTLYNARRPVLRIRIDLARLTARAVMVQELESALRLHGVESSRIESTDGTVTFLSRTVPLPSPEQLGGIVVKLVSGVPIRLADVALLEIGSDADERRTPLAPGGEVTLGVVRLPTVQPAELLKEVRAWLPGLRARLPHGFEVAVAYEASAFPLGPPR